MKGKKCRVINSSFRLFSGSNHNHNIVLPFLVIGFIFIASSSWSVLICNAQILELNKSPHPPQLSQLYHRINRGAYTMLHELTRRRYPAGVQPRFSADPQIVTFSKNHSTESNQRSSYVNDPSEGVNVNDPAMTSYINNVLDQTMLYSSDSYNKRDSDRDFYSANYWDSASSSGDDENGASSNPTTSSSLSSLYGNYNGEIFSQSSSGAGYYPSTSSSTFSQPRRPPSSSSSEPDYSFFGPPSTSISSPSTSNRLPKIYQNFDFKTYNVPIPAIDITNNYRNTPLSKSAKSYSSHGHGQRPRHRHYHRRPSSSPVTKSHGHHYRPPKPNKRPRRPFRIPFVSLSYSSDPEHDHGWGHRGHHHNKGWGQGHHHHGDAWGWGWHDDHHGWGWGWPEKPKCDPDAPPFELNSYDDIPTGATFVDGYGKMSTRDDLPPTLVPSPPVLFTISGNSSSLPLNYSNKLRERLEIKLNSDGSTNFNRDVVMRPNSTGQGQRGQGQGSTSSSSLSSSEDGIEMITSVIESPYMSAPINGSSNSNKFFQQALAARAEVFKEPQKHPLVAQLDSLQELWNELDELQQEQNEQEAEIEAQLELDFFKASNAGWGWSWDQVQGQGQGQGQGQVEGQGDNADPAGSSNLASPIVIVMVQRFSVPEPNTSEAGMLDAAFNFGPQANRFAFGDLDRVTSSWKKAVQASTLSPPAPLNLNTLSAGGVFPNTGLNERIRGYVSALRDASTAAYEPLEEMAYSGFEQHQYFIVPMDECQQPIDPPKFRGTMSNNCAFGPVNANQNAPSCFPPREC